MSKEVSSIDALAATIQAKEHTGSASSAPEGSARALLGDACGGSTVGLSERRAGELPGGAIHVRIPAAVVVRHRLLAPGTFPTPVKEVLVEAGDRRAVVPLR